MMEDVTRDASKAVAAVRRNVKLATGFDHHSTDLQHVVNKYPEASHHLKRIASGIKRAAVDVSFPVFKHKYPDRSVDIGAFAKNIARKHVFKHMPKPKKGGSLEDIKYAVNLGRKFKGVADEIQYAKSAYDGVDFHPKDARQFFRSAASAYQGNFSVASAYMKGAGAVARPMQDELEAAGTGFHLISKGIGEIRSMI